uniref:Reverse transcriptase Ty1/copia-type domain-containing protein n=1 Tax=Solanum lycopersicum TaxID=4081 RepID=A0A3Q7HL56_SOLLC
MFMYRSSLGVLLLLLYVDDIILTDSHIGLLNQFISRLSNQFAMKYLGDLHFFDIQEVPSRTNISLVDGELHSDPSEYTRIVGALQYLTMTRLDIAYAVNVAGCPDSRCSTKGSAIFLGPNIIAWRAKKQPTVSTSSMEAECRAVAYTVAETCLIRHILCELAWLGYWVVFVSVIMAPFWIVT